MEISVLVNTFLRHPQGSNCSVNCYFCLVFCLLYCYICGSPEIKPNQTIHLKDGFLMWNHIRRDFIWLWQPLSKWQLQFSLLFNCSGHTK